MRVWDPKAKLFERKPAHTCASHYADALACFARGFKGDPREYRKLKGSSSFNVFTYDRSPTR